MTEVQNLRRQLYGKDSHVHVVDALEGLDAITAGTLPSGAPHSIFQILRHMIYWQNIALARIRGETPDPPKRAAEGWTTETTPKNDRVWDGAVEEFTAGLRDLEALLVSSGDIGRVVEPARKRTARQNFLMVIQHNSYHVGQIVALRQQLGAWPPPKGGDTW